MASNDECPLGWVAPADRTPEQHEAHGQAVATMPKFAAPETPAGPVNVRLFDYWKQAEVIEDCGGVEFHRFRQLTGSCVGAGGGQALFSLIAVQRCVGDAPTKAFIPFWLYDYGKSRLRAGWRSPGEGSLGSTFAVAVSKDGVIDWAKAGLPAFNTADGIAVPANVEMAWSDGDTAAATALDPVAREHPVGTAAQLRTVEEIRAAIINGYPVTFACNNNISRAAVKGSGADAVLLGSWDSYGPHQQSIHAVWDHPTLGPLYWAQNNWPASVYPKDPAGGPPCGCWVTEANVKAALRLDAEVFAFSHLDWFPAQPKVLAWFVAP